jgi:hypothetical protein
MFFEWRHGNGALCPVNPQLIELVGGIDDRLNKNLITDNKVYLSLMAQSKRAEFGISD